MVPPSTTLDFTIAIFSVVGTVGWFYWTKRNWSSKRPMRLITLSGLLATGVFLFRVFLRYGFLQSGDGFPSSGPFWRVFPVIAVELVCIVLLVSILLRSRPNEGRSNNTPTQEG